jgi:hypothetical protein
MLLEASFTLLEVSFVIFIVQASLTIITYNCEMFLVQAIGSKVLPVTNTLTYLAHSSVNEPRNFF